MPKFKIQAEETQYWVYEYEVEAKSSEEALHLAEAIHYSGEQSDNSTMADCITTSMRIKEHAHEL